MKRARHHLAWIICLAAAAPAASSQTISATQPDPALQAQLIQIDAKAGQIMDLTAHFDQKKFTAILKKPLLSSPIRLRPRRRRHLPTDPPDA